MLTEEAIQILYDLFIQRKDTYAQQNPNGTYTRIEKELTLQDITEHLEGKKTIGAYQLNQENKVKWICFDFDGQPEEQKKYATTFYEQLQKENTEPLLEFSGMKGYHIWILCQETNAANAKTWATETSEKFGVHEIFPKQEKIETGGYGNLVKLPLCIHQVSKKRSCFLSKNFEELSLHESIELLKQALQKPKFQVPKIIIREIVRTIIKPSEKKNMPTYISQLIQRGAKPGERHYNCWVIARELYHCGFTKEETLEQLKCFNTNSTPPKAESIIENHANILFAFPEKYLLKETITEQELQDLKKTEKISYEQVIKAYQKWFHLKDVKAIDLSLAVAIARKEKMQPMWIIMIAASGSGKSELLRPFSDDNQPSTTETMSKITPNTFLSGINATKTPHIDFAETLENNPKLFLTFDFAQFIKLDSEQKAQIWAQMRDIYDGFIERKAFNVSKKVENLKINWLICSTPVVDTELLIHQELGTRELIYRFDEEENKKNLMKKVWDNSEKLGEMRKELKALTRAFINQKEVDGFKTVEIKDCVREELEKLALTISILRAATECEQISGELANFVYPEMPTRILLQLKDLFVALKNLDEDYSDEKALQVLRKIAISSIHPIRLKIMRTLIDEKILTTTQLQKKLEIGYKTLVTQLYTASQLELVLYEEMEKGEDWEGEKRWKKKTWRVNEYNEVVCYLKAKFLE